MSIVNKQLWPLLNVRRCGPMYYVTEGCLTSDIDENVWFSIFLVGFHLSGRTNCLSWLLCFGKTASLQLTIKTGRYRCIEQTDFETRRVADRLLSLSEFIKTLHDGLCLFAANKVRTDQVRTEKRPITEWYGYLIASVLMKKGRWLSCAITNFGHICFSAFS